VLAIVEPKALSHIQ
jgi:hypothetical protein